MPYTHPSGVKCLTPLEFWDSVAKSEGKETYEVMEDFYTDLANEQKRERQRLMQDFDGALQALQDWFSAEDDSSFQPIAVTEITDAGVSYGRNNSSFFVANVTCSDGINRWMKYSESSYGGGFYEPPDFESNCQILNDSDMSC